MSEPTPEALIGMIRAWLSDYRYKPDSMLGRISEALDLLASQSAEIATLKQAKREQEKEHSADVVQLVREIAATKNRAEAEIATLRQEHERILDETRDYIQMIEANNATLRQEREDADAERLQAVRRSEAAEDEAVRANRAQEAAEAENARLRASASALAKDWLDRSCLSLCMHDTCRCRKTLAAQLYALLAPPAETEP